MDPLNKVSSLFSLGTEKKSILVREFSQQFQALVTRFLWEAGKIFPFGLEDNAGFSAMLLELGSRSIGNVGFEAHASQNFFACKSRKAKSTMLLFREFCCNFIKSFLFDVFKSFESVLRVWKSTSCEYFEYSLTW